MINEREIAKAKKRTEEYFKKAKIAITKEELKNIEVADFGLGDLELVGLQIVVYVNTARVCAKEMILFPYQLCPQHKHPSINNSEGKEETFRCRYGEVYLYLPGDRIENMRGKIPEKYKDHFSVLKR